MNTTKTILPTNAQFEKTTDDAFSYSFNVSPDLPHFKGHFPNNPLVPGVTQISWCLNVIDIDRGSPVFKYKISRFKFIKPILPNDRILISVTKKDLRYSFKISNNQELAASGSISISEHE